MDINTLAGATLGMAEASILYGLFYGAAREKLNKRISLVVAGVLGSGLISAMSGATDLGYGARQVALLWAGAAGGVAGSFEGEWLDVYSTLFSAAVGYSAGVFQLPFIDAAVACLGAFATGRLGSILTQSEKKQ